MPITYTPIATTTLGSNQTSVTFNSISGSYTDLVLICNYFKSASNAMGFTINNNTSAIYSYTTLYNLNTNGTTASSNRGSNDTTGYFLSYGAHSTTDPNIYIANFQNYSNTTTFKTVIGKGGDPSRSVGTDVTLYRSTSAITRIDVNTRGIGTINTGSTFTLYGIKAA
jgi:hypothetical protein